MMFHTVISVCEIYSIAHELPLQWRHNECHSVSNHRRLDGLCNRLFIPKSKKTLKRRVTGLCEEKNTGDRWIPLTKGQ